MRVVVLGGDGYQGETTAMHLTATSHEVAVLDNLHRAAQDSAQHHDTP